MKKRKYPNLFIIGAPKCGTTSLAHWLSEHPDVYFFIGSEKDGKIEPHFWATDLKLKNKWSEDEYFSLFDKDFSKYKYVGESSVWYLMSKEAVNNIEKNIQNPKYIVCIRNPVDMCYSLWYQWIKSGAEFETRDFLRAFSLSDRRSSGECVKMSKHYDPLILSYKYSCAIGSQLERLYNTVPNERIFVIVLDDVKENPRREWLRLLNFLELEDDGRVDFPVKNKRTILRNKFLYIIYKLFLHYSRLTFSYRKKVGLVNIGISKVLRHVTFRQATNIEAQMDSKIREALLNAFLPEIEKVERILGRKFEEWRI